MSLGAEQPCSVVRTAWCVWQTLVFHVLPCPQSSSEPTEMSQEAMGSPKTPTAPTLATALEDVGMIGKGGTALVVTEWAGAGLGCREEP